MNMNEAQSLKSLDDDQLEALYAEVETDKEVAAVLREMKRRERKAEQSRQDREWWARVHAEWYDFMFAQYLAAEDECRGNLLSKEGLKAGIADPISLWSGSRARAMKMASEELREFWATHPRVTVSEYAYRAARPGRGNREQ